MTLAKSPLAVLFLLAACGADAPPEAADAEDQRTRPEHFLSEHHKALDKARNVQHQLNASVEERLEQLDRQTRDDRDEDD